MYTVKKSTVIWLVSICIHIETLILYIISLYIYIVYPLSITGLININTMETTHQRIGVRKYVKSEIPRLRWTPELHEHFVRTVKSLGGKDSKKSSIQDSDSVHEKKIFKPKIITRILKTPCNCLFRNRDFIIMKDLCNLASN